MQVVSDPRELKFEGQVDLCQEKTGICVSCGSFQLIVAGNVTDWETDCFNGGAVADILNCSVKFHELIVFSEIEVFGQGKL